MKILIRNLARTTTEKELASYFAVYGMVQSCDLVLDKATGKSKGFAFVEMPKAGEAKVAIKKLNNREIAGNKVRVKKAETKVDLKVESTPENGVDDKVNAGVTEKLDVAEENTTKAEGSGKKFSWQEKKLI